MTRDVLAIPMEELREQLQTNRRQDVKIIVPQRLSDAQCDQLRARGGSVKYERAASGPVWKHASEGDPNWVCESSEFAGTSKSPPVNQADGVQAASREHGPFALSAANDRRPQDWHLHPKHGEIYVSVEPMGADYQSSEDGKIYSVKLEHGGVMIFAPGVPHHVSLGGLTIIVETPSLENDKERFDPDKLAGA